MLGGILEMIIKILELGISRVSHHRVKAQWRSTVFGRNMWVRSFPVIPTTRFWSSPSLARGGRWQKRGYGGLYRMSHYGRMRTVVFSLSIAYGWAMYT